MARSFSKNTANYAVFPINSIGPLVNGASAVTVVGQAYVNTATTTLGDNGLFLSFVNDLSALGVAIGTGTNRRLIGFGRSRAADPQAIINGSADLPLSQWVGWGVIFDFANNQIRIWQDGTANGSGTATYGGTSYVHTANPNCIDHIGAANGAVAPPPPPTSAVQLDGALDHVGVYKRALTDSEIASITSRQSRATEIQVADLVAYYELDGTGTTEPSDVAGGPTLTITGSIPQFSPNPTIGVTTKRKGASTSLRLLRMRGR